MLALLTLAKPPAASSGSPGWTSAQREELQLQALATVCTLAPLMLDDYTSHQGNASLLLLLDHCVAQGDGTRERLGRGPVLYAKGHRLNTHLQAHCLPGVHCSLTHATSVMCLHVSKSKNKKGTTARRQCLHLLI